MTLKLNEDQKAHTIKQLREGASSMGMAAKILTDRGEIEAEFLQSLLSLTEFTLASISDTTGVKTQSQDEVQKRYADIRAANGRVHELESKLGERVSPADTKESLKVLTAKLNDWWDKDGFGHISDITFDQWGCRLNLSCMLHGQYSYSMSETPVSDKENHSLWLDSLVDRGFTLAGNNRRVDMHIVDTPKAREILVDLIAKAFPSGNLTSLETHVNRGTDFELRGISVFISDLADIAAL